MKDFFKKHYHFMALIIVAVAIGINLLGSSRSVVLTAEGIRQYNYNKVNVGDEAIAGTSRVTFDAFLLQDNDSDGVAEKYRGQSINVTKNDKLWLELKVLGDVTLKNASLEFVSSNVKVEGSIVKDSTFKDTIISDDISKIELNEISVGTTKLFYLGLNPSLTNDITSFSRNNKVILKGTVVENGQEKTIEKEVEYLINWYGLSNGVKTYIDEDYKTTANTVKFDSNDNVVVTYNFNINEKNGILPLESTDFEASVGKLNGYDPVSVKVEGINTTFTYDDNLKKIVASHGSALENNVIKQNAYSYTRSVYSNNSSIMYSIDGTTGLATDGQNVYSQIPESVNSSEYESVTNFVVTVEYPHAASLQDGTATLNIDAWHDVYNNEVLTNSITNGIKANKTLIANYKCDGGTGNVTTILSSVKLGRYSGSGVEEYYIDKTNTLNMYNNIDSKDTIYSVSITPYVNFYNPLYPVDKIYITDLGPDKINDNMGMDAFLTYHSITLPAHISDYLGISGYVKVIDNDSGEVLHVFTSLDFDKSYIFEKDVRSVTLEISNLIDDTVIRNVSSGLPAYLFNINIEKKIDNKYLVNNVSLDTFKTYEYISTGVRTDWTSGSYISKNDAAIVDAPGRVIQRVAARFANGLSNFTFESNTQSVEAAQEKNVKFNIKTSYASSDTLYKSFKDAEFLIKIPDEIMSFDVNDITIKDNNTTVNIEKYEMKVIDGHNFLKIVTSNTNPGTFNIEVDADIIADPTVINKTVTLGLYVYNPYCHNYSDSTSDIYDVNDNNDMVEKVGYKAISMNLLAPTEVITTTTLIDYNGKTVSSPLIGEITPESSQAKISVNLINNSQFAIKDLVIVGKIGFVGNTYQVGDQNASLGSEFNTTMTSGITPPSSLASKTRVYYSTLEKPTANLNDTNNGWVENVTDFSNIKTYMIVIDDYQMNTGEIQKFTYNVDMPITTANLLKKTYFTHGVYYNAITDRGLVESSTGSSKLGVTYVRKYDMNLKTFRKGTNKLITPIKYLITDDQGNSKTLKADIHGNISFNGLYVNQEYTLKQISVSDDYEINEDVRTFRVSVGSNDDLVLTNSNNYKSIELTNTNKLNLEVENNVRYTVIVKNTDLQTDANISGSKFKITGKGYEDGYTTVTNVNGELTLKGLYLDEAYTLEQTFANGHEKVDGAFRVRVIFDKTDNKVKMCIEKVPEITTFTKTTDSSTTVFEKTSSFGDNQATFRNNSSTTTNKTKAYMELDLTSFEDNYRLTLSGNYGYHGHVELYLTDFLVTRITDLNSNHLGYSYDHTNSSTNSYISKSLTEVKQSNGNTITFAGGKKYYLYLYQYPLTNKSLAAFTLYINADSGTKELVKTDLLTTNINDNSKLIQTIEDDLTKSQPVLRVQVKNQVIPKTTVKIVKKDAETGEVLKNAQYRVEGPSISGQGLILTTNENGEASFEAYEKYTGNDYYYVGLSNSSEVYDNPYTITEIAAPDGYSLDSKPVVFYVENNIKCPATGTCDINNYISDIKIKYETNEFINTSYDSSTDTMSVEVHDYPIVKIVKRDGETGELLPNTLFSISKVKRKDGKETLSQALDINGNPVGNLVRINDEDLYVISTNSKGALNLNLQMGQYKLKEVQASSEKYELTNQVYYFGVGETVPFQAEGINLVDSFYIGYPTLAVDTYNTYSDVFIPVSDGYVGSKKSVITKYNLDGSIAWTKDFAGQLKYKKKYTYFDKDDVYVQDIPTTISGVKSIIELSNGDILVVFNSDGQSLVRISSSGTTLWVEDVFENITHFTRRDIKNPNGTYQDYQLTDIDNEIYSGSQVRVNNRKQLIYAITADKNGGFTLITKNSNSTYYNDSYQGFKLKDGTLLEYGKEYKDNGSYHDMYGNFNSYSKSLFVLKYDNENDMVSGKEISHLLMDTAKSYFSDKGYSINPNYIGYYSGYAFGNIDLYDDGGLIFSVYNVANIDYAMKLDRNYNLVYYTPIVINGKTSNNYYNNDQKRLFALEDGGFRIYSRYSRSGSYTNVPSPNSSILTTGNSYIASEDAFVIEYDNQGLPKNNIVRLNTGYNSGAYNYPDDYIYTVATGSSTYYGGVVKVDDGYIVAVPRSNYSSSTSVKLDSGEKINLTGNVLIFKVNNDSRIVWLKQYNSSAYSEQNIKSMFIDKNNRLNITFYSQGAADSVVVEEVGGESVLDTQGVAGYYNVVFDISEVVYPSAAEAYTLNIDNIVKEYKVNVSTGSGSTITVKDGSSITYQGNGPVLSEKVKYGNNSTKNITISLENGYVVTSVSVNGKDLSYKVNDDFSITLDKIANITEDQNIEVSTKLGSSSVIVHHYKENTKERIASDEILTGTIGTRYETSPIVSRLYSLITDSDGKYVLPSNHDGSFDSDRIVVTYYYKENDVELIVNYYLENTETALAPKKTEKKILGSKYKTEPANIDFYKVTRILGEEEGVLNQKKTSVTYFYQESSEALVNVKYVDISSGKELSKPVTFKVERHQTYETVEASDIPKNYRLKNKTNNYKGQAESAVINVVYYYEVIPFNASVEKRISSIIVNDENIKIKDPKIAKLEQRKGDSVIVYYDIIVKNTGDIKAKIEIKEHDIKNFVIYDAGEFDKTKDGYITKVEIEPGQEKKYRIGYKWDQKGYGTSKNEVELSKVTNELGFDEVDNKDNISSAEIILGIPTGAKYKAIVTVIGGTIVSAVLVGVVVTRRKRRIS